MTDSGGPQAEDQTQHEFYWSAEAEPHSQRRREILAKYGPQVRALYGYDNRTAVQVRPLLTLIRRCRVLMRARYRRCQPDNGTFGGDRLGYVRCWAARRRNCLRFRCSNLGCLRRLLAVGSCDHVLVDNATQCLQQS